MRAAVFLDRDGVLNQAIVRDGIPHPPASVNELVLDQDASVALTALKALGYLLVVVTNQPDVARGAQTIEAIDAIHAYLAALLPLDDFLVCYHDDADNCDCRKPRPGLLHAAARRFGIDLTRSFMIGDRWRDIDAGNAAGVRVILIDHGYGEERRTSSPFAVTHSLREAAASIITETDLEPAGRG